MNSDHAIFKVAGELSDYLVHGVGLRGFALAVVQNDLRFAAHCGTAEQIASLKDIVSWCEIHAPETAWGSPERYHRWIGLTDAERRVERREPRRLRARGEITDLLVKRLMVERDELDALVVRNAERIRVLKQAGEK